ncbi:MAG TPA: FtsX-like permease family protein [Rhodanobacteraceae bacterium]
MRHIIQPLLRHRLMPLLVVLQVALACAIACNALFLLQQKLTPILTPDGIGQPSHLIVASNIAARMPWPTSQLYATELALRAIPGVTAVSVAGSLPMTTSGKMYGEVHGASTHTKSHATVYIGDHLVQALDLKLVAGRNFTAAEQATQYHSIGINANGPTIITAALARRLFPNGHALGQVIRIGKTAGKAQRTVVGVVAHLLSNDLGSGQRSDIGNTMLFPGIPGMWPIPAYAVRIAHAADAPRIRKAVAATIKRELGAGMVTGFHPRVKMYAALRHKALARPRAAVWLLAGVSMIVLIVAMAGIMGLTSYWVQQRTRQIGIRRALGARRRDILRYIQLENLLVVGAGVVLGLLSAYDINLWLMQHYELERLPWTWLPAGAILLLVLGQLAVLKPALSAARVPPVVATRSA